MTRCLVQGKPGRRSNSYYCNENDNSSNMEVRQGQSSRVELVMNSSERRDAVEAERKSREVNVPVVVVRG